MKKLLPLLLSLTMLLIMATAASAAGFADVDQGAWYAGAVDYVVSNKLMRGYSADKFGPNDALSRAMVVQTLYNKEGQPAQSGKHSFNDVAATDWFNNAVTWGTAKGIMSGYGEGKFAPNDNVTLEQIAVILWNYSGKPTPSGSADAVGVHSNWAANGLAWAIEKGLFNNLPFLSVTAAASRAQTAQMLTNFLSAKTDAPVATGISLDITSHKMGEDWTQYLTPILSPAGAKDTITWTSSNPKVATVNEKGKVSGVAGGTTTITAKLSNGKTATCKIEVWHSHKLTDTKIKNGGTLEIYTCPCGDSYENWIPLTLPGNFPMEFIFSSGAGGWGTFLTLYADGSFEGEFHDSDMGVTGYGYPNGTAYISPFHGKFTVEEQLSSSSYRLSLSDLTLEIPVGKEWIENGIYYIATEPYGLDDGKTFVFYTPDARTSGLDEDFLSWLFFYQTPPRTLGRYGIWNTSNACGFFNYPNY